MHNLSISKSDAVVEEEVVVAGVEEEAPAPALVPAPVVEAVEVALAVHPLPVAVRVRPATEAAPPAEALGFPHPTAAAGMISSNPSHDTTYGSSGGGSSGGSSWPWMWNPGSSSGRAKTPKMKTQKPMNTITNTKTFGHNRYYAGGARAPYTSGTRSASGITPFLLPVAALAFFPGIWLAGAYAYPYTHPYYYHNNTNNKNESLPVVCLCEEYQECGCDDNNNSTYYESLFNGTQPHNTSMVRVANVNGTEKIVINGTLANGTTADNGSTSSSSSSTSGAAQGPLVTLVNASGYWVMVAVVIATVWSF